MIKKINKILLKLKKDNKSLHQIDISSKYVQTNFNFNYFEGHLTKNGNDRLFAFAKYIFTMTAIHWSWIRKVLICKYKAFIRMSTIFNSD